MHAAAGGVGLLLTQLAAQRGARVIATVGQRREGAPGARGGRRRRDPVPRARRPDPRPAGRGAGADRRPRRARRLRLRRQGHVRRVPGLACAARGTLVLFGGSSGPVPPVDPQRLNAAGSLFLTRPTLDHYIATRDELDWRARELFDAVRAGDARRARRRHVPPGRRGRRPPRARVALHHRKGAAAPVTIPTLYAVRTLSVEVWSDIACPWCYIGKRRFADRAGRLPAPGARRGDLARVRAVAEHPRRPRHPGDRRARPAQGHPARPGDADVRAGHGGGRGRGSRLRLRPGDRRQHVRGAPPGPPGAHDGRGGAGGAGARGSVLGALRARRRPGRRRHARADRQLAQASTPRPHGPRWPATPGRTRSVPTRTRRARSA